MQPFTMQILFPPDSLRLKKIAISESIPGHTEADIEMLCFDEGHLKEIPH